MKRSSITLPDTLAAALESYIRDQDAQPTVTAVVQVALAQYLEQRGYLCSRKQGFRITPAPRGSGFRDTSLLHDQLLADPEAGPRS